MVLGRLALGAMEGEGGKQRIEFVYQGAGLGNVLLEGRELPLPSPSPLERRPEEKTDEEKRKGQGSGLQQTWRKMEEGSGATKWRCDLA
jgi:hypothetical protein